MRKFLTTVLTAVMALNLASCTLEYIDGNRVTGGSLSIDVDVENTTKAAMTEDELLKTAEVRIYMADYSGLIRKYSYTDMPKYIYLPTDSYRVDVEAGESMKADPSYASWDKKSYKGSTLFDVRSGANTSVKVIAGVSDAVTAVSFDEGVTSEFSSYTLTVGTSATDASRQLVYDSTTDGKDGYFIVEGQSASLYWSFSGVRNNGLELEKSGEIEDVSGGKRYAMTFSYTVKDGTLGFKVAVDDSTVDFDDVIIFDPISTGLTPIPANAIWAGHTRLTADVDESEYGDPSKIAFAYSHGGEWTTVAAVRAQEGVYTADIKGLKPSTQYSYKLLIAGQEVGKTLTFTTDAAPQLPNSGFEYTSNTENKNWVSFYDPAATDASARTKWWDNGSSASAGMLGSKYAICHTDTDVPAGIGSTRSAKLTSINAVVKFAAGNIFSGEFAGLDGMNGKVNFGRPWTSRPTAVRFWYKYKGGKVDAAGGPEGSKLTTSDYDLFQVKVAVGTWDYRVYGGSRTSPVQVNTSKPSTFWDYDKIEGTIAYGQYTERGNGSESDWRQITIPLEYKSETEIPTHIVFSAASSIYGDYFVGSYSSVLWLDEVELIYE